MAREWTDEEVQAEIREAVRIVQEDKDRAAYKQLHERFGQAPTEPDNPKDNPGVPPQKDNNGEPAKKGRKSLWWGNALEGDEQ